MKRNIVLFAIVSAIFAVLTVSCGSAPTPTVAPTTTAVPTATATAMPSETPTATPISTLTSTATPTNTATPTRTPTPTNTPTSFPTATPQPVFVWKSSFNSLGDFPDNGNIDRRGRYNIIPDPTGSGRGMVMKCEAAPDLAYFDPQYQPNGRTVVRSYPAYYFPAKKGPHIIGLDVYVEDNFSPRILATNDGPLLSLLSDFYDTEGFGKKWSVAATADLWTKKGVSGYFLALHNVKNWEANPLPSAPQFTFKEWHQIEISVAGDGKITLFQDGQIVTVGKLADEADLATAGGHPGLYGLSADGAHKAPFDSGTLYNDNWSMIVWPQ